MSQTLDNPTDQLPIGDKHQALLNDLAQQRSTARAMGSKNKLAALHERGDLNARQRITQLFDENSFLEVGLHAYSGPDAGKAAADGKIAGYGLIEQRPVAAVVNDFTVKGASSTNINGKKIAHMKRMAAERGMPLVFLGESSGARIPDTMGAEGMGSSGQDPTQYLRKRETPWASAVLGPCFGSSNWYTCLSDFKVMKRGALLSVTSTQLMDQATGQVIDPQEAGGWQLHAQTTGLIDQFVDTDEQAITAIQRFLSYLPSHCDSPPPRVPVPPGSGADLHKIYSILPESRTQVYDIRRIIKLIVDQDSWFELKPDFGKAAVTALARIDGRTVAIIASNPIAKGGALDVAACQKITNFIVMSDSFNIPIVNFVDVPGFGIGLEAERRAISARIMNYMSAIQAATVPKFSVFLRKVYGQAYLNMGGGRNSDEVALWPSAEVGFMAPAAAVTVVHGKDLSPKEFAVKEQELARATNPWRMAGIMAAQHVIAPTETRDFLRRCLDFYCSDSQRSLSKRHLANWPCYL
ncbi:MULTISPECIES: acyl-CoA carboxylase subunit beta [unclassified Comamonas]|uniref:acyl-CoA carboxylase subunit beta n=1 Tax=unclassified Comamonas TaxID=2638500 RepID=UPI001FA80E76|nr:MULTISPECIES: carboxyl transferase domain-containing protein [unclassified Comamonas]UNV88543.1 methylmalonyl-CoA carboxyltransferase [Comamonas sp. 7D-2evo1]UNV93554.1 methylmalonyl-CoA carboxyltransferase [Comamonas sp. 7D-2]UNV98186.1 methylmalonyl-CoA carboxyltransferase [Comamonas sp. 7D-2evo2]